MEETGIFGKTNNLSKRLEWVDIAKGIGILLMIIGHTSLSNYPYLENFIYCFHMPLFFIISGYFFKYRDNKECIKNVFKRLILPYIITCIVIILYKVFREVLDGNYYNIMDIIKTWGLASLYGSGSGTHFGIRHIGAIWFLLALAFATYFMNIIYKKENRVLWVILIAYIGYKTSKYVWLPFSIQAGMCAIIFMYIGMIAKEKNILDKKLSALTYIALIGIVAFGVKYCSTLYMVNNYYADGLLNIIVAVVGTFFCVKLCQVVEKFVPILRKAIAFIGKNSLLCLCIHLISLDCLKWQTAYRILDSFGITNFTVKQGIVNILWVVCVLALIKSVLKIKDKIKNKL